MVISFCLLDSNSNIKNKKIDKMETSGLGNEGRKKPSLVEYKQVILELNQALNSLS